MRPGTRYNAASMFTGIVQAMKPVRAVRKSRAGLRFDIDVPFDPREGDSIAVNGVCLTWNRGGFDAIPETLARTNLGALRRGRLVNLEPALRVGDRLGSHFVLGHVDGLGSVAAVERRGKETKMWIAMPVELSRYVASKGSIAVDGVGLTVVDAEPDRFSVALIPYTLEHTTLGRARKGARVNLEVDLFARYAKKGSGITKAFLSRAGFVPEE